MRRGGTGGLGHAHVPCVDVVESIRHTAQPPLGQTPHILLSPRASLPFAARQEGEGSRRRTPKKDFSMDVRESETEEMETEDGEDMASITGTTDKTTTRVRQGHHHHHHHHHNQDHTTTTTTKTTGATIGRGDGVPVINGVPEHCLGRGHRHLQQHKKRHYFGRECSGNTRKGTVLAANAVETQEKALVLPRMQWKHNAKALSWPRTLWKNQAKAQSSHRRLSRNHPRLRQRRHQHRRLVGMHLWVEAARPA